MEVVTNHHDGPLRTISPIQSISFTGRKKSLVFRRSAIAELQRVFLHTAVYSKLLHVQLIGALSSSQFLFRVLVHLFRAFLLQSMGSSASNFSPSFPHLFSVPLPPSPTNKTNPPSTPKPPKQLYHLEPLYHTLQTSSTKTSFSLHLTIKT